MTAKNWIPAFAGMTKSGFLYLFFCYFSFFATINLFANTLPSLTHTEKQLKTIVSHADRLKKLLEKSKNQYHTLLEELKTTELKINKLDKDFKKTQTEIQQNQIQLNQLQSEQNQKEQELTQQQQLLTQQIKATYRSGSHDYLKLILNQESISDASRLLIYYQYFNRSRAEIIKKMQATIADISVRQQPINAKMQELTELLEQQKQQQQQLILNKNYRQQVVIKLKQQIEHQHTTLQTLEENKHTLSNLIHRIKYQSYWQHNVKPFTKMQHKLSWPTKGKINQHFGEPIKNSQLTSSGVFIAAKEGQEVRAIYPGKVVFADWLRGFGLLMIIDHNRGYLSLYAHNHSLYKNSGEQVLSGDLIATVGHSGGNQKDGLYFEIRHQENPLNPEQWCTWKVIK